MARRLAATAPRPDALGFGALALAVAAAVGAAAAVKPMYAVALVLAGAVALLVASDIHALPPFLVFTVFIENVAVGPLRVGRLAGGLAILALLYFVLARGRADLRGNLLLALVGAYGVWNLASLYWADAAGPAYTNLLSYLLAIAYMLTIAVLVRSEAQLKTLFATLALGSVAFGTLAFVTYAGSTPAPGEESLRAQGLAGDPNYFAVYQVAALPVVLVLAAIERRPLRRLVFYSAIGIIVLSVTSTLSRTGLLSLIAVVLATLVIPTHAFFRDRVHKLAYVVALAVAGALAVAVGSTAFVQRAQTILDPSAEGDRGSGRTDLYAAAVRGWHEQPWVGLGSGNFSYHSLRLLQTTPGVDTSRNYVRAGRVTHNAYLETLTELGVVGFAIFVSLLAVAARYLLLAYRRAHAVGAHAVERFAIAIFVALLGYCVSAFFLSNQLGKLLWVLVGLALALDVVARQAAPGVAVSLLPDLRRGRGAVGARARPYDQAMGDRLLEQRERRLAEEFDAIRAERKRLARLEQMLDERAAAQKEPVVSPELEAREAAVEARVAELEAREAAVDADVAELETREAAVEGRVAELEAREAAVEGRVAELESREAAVDAGVAELEAREREQRDAAEAIAEREQALERRIEQISHRELAVARKHAELAARERELAEAAAAAAAVPEPEPEPEPAVAAPPPAPEPLAVAPPPARESDVAAPPAPEPLPVAAREVPTLMQLEHLVDAHGHEYPDNVDEWRYYLLYLRDHADYDGRLPASFDYLVYDVFAALLGR